MNEPQERPKGGKRCCSTGVERTREEAANRRKGWGQRGEGCWGRTVLKTGHGELMADHRHGSLLRRDRRGDFSGGMAMAVVEVNNGDGKEGVQVRIKEGRPQVWAGNGLADGTGSNTTLRGRGFLLVGRGEVWEEVNEFPLRTSEQAKWEPPVKKAGADRGMGAPWGSSWRCRRVGADPIGLGSGNTEERKRSGPRDT